MRRYCSSSSSKLKGGRREEEGEEEGGGGRREGGRREEKGLIFLSYEVNYKTLRLTIKQERTIGSVDSIYKYLN